MVTAAAGGGGGGGRPRLHESRAPAAGRGAHATGMSASPPSGCGTARGTRMVRTPSRTLAWMPVDEAGGVRGGGGGGGGGWWWFEGGGAARAAAAQQQQAGGLADAGGEGAGTTARSGAAQRRRAAARSAQTARGGAQGESRGGPAAAAVAHGRRGAAGLKHDYFHARAGAAAAHGAGRTAARRPRRWAAPAPCSSTCARTHKAADIICVKGAWRRHAPAARACTCLASRPPSAHARLKIPARTARTARTRALCACAVSRGAVRGRARGRRAARGGTCGVPQGRAAGKPVLAHMLTTIGCGRTHAKFISTRAGKTPGRDLGHTRDARSPPREPPPNGGRASAGSPPSGSAARALAAGRGRARRAVAAHHAPARRCVRPAAGCARAAYASSALRCALSPAAAPSRGRARALAFGGACPRPRGDHTNTHHPPPQSPSCLPFTTARRWRPCSTAARATWRWPRWQRRAGPRRRRPRCCSGCRRARARARLQPRAAPLVRGVA